MARVLLRPTPAGSFDFPGFAPETQSAPDGSFRLDGVLAGEYRVSITAQGDYFVKEAKLDRADVLNRSVELSERRSESPVLEIVLSPNVAQIDGVAFSDRGQPVAGARVVLVPDGNRDRSELFVAATADQSGRFSMRRITPGDYRLYAWEAIENNAYFDPDLLKRSESAAKAVHIDESAKLNLDAKVIVEPSSRYLPNR